MSLPCVRTLEGLCIRHEMKCKTRSNCSKCSVYSFNLVWVMRFLWVLFTIYRVPFDGFNSSTVAHHCSPWTRLTDAVVWPKMLPNALKQHLANIWFEALVSGFIKISHPIKMFQFMFNRKRCVLHPLKRAPVFTSGAIKVTIKMLLLY